MCSSYNIFLIYVSLHSPRYHKPPPNLPLRLFLHSNSSLHDPSLVLPFNLFPVHGVNSMSLTSFHVLFFFSSSLHPSFLQLRPHFTSPSSHIQTTKCPLRSIVDLFRTISSPLPSLLSSIPFTRRSCVCEGLPAYHLLASGQFASFASPTPIPSNIPTSLRRPANPRGGSVQRWQYQGDSRGGRLATATPSSTKGCRVWEPRQLL